MLWQLYDDGRLIKAIMTEIMKNDFFQNDLFLFFYYFIKFVQ